MKRFFAIAFVIVLFVCAAPPSKAETGDADGYINIMSAYKQKIMSEIKTDSGNPVTVSGGTTTQPPAAATDPKSVDMENNLSGYGSPKYEMRAAWIATVTNIDMPEKMDKAAFTKWADATCSKLSGLNFNTVVFQVKPLADALYKSNYAPYSQYITGKQGVDPGYDPLEIMLTAAHGYGLELHAWMNPYRVTMPSFGLDTLADSNIAKKCPGWINKYGNQYYLNPGIPDVRNYLVGCVNELVSNYDIDAVHLDDYFYPYPVSGEKYPDDAQYKLYGSQYASVGDFRRANVNSLVREINNTIKARKPWVQFGISPFGVWRNKASDSSGSETQALENYESLYADTRQWLKDGSIDYLAPQIYWTKEFPKANYNVLIDWWNNEAKTYALAHGVNLYVGLADYRMGEPTSTDKGWSNSGEISLQITGNRNKDAISGQMHFSYSSITRNNLGYADALVTNQYKDKAINPKTPWNGATAPLPPTGIRLENISGAQSGGSLRITVTDTQPAVRKYVIYRFEQSDEGNYNDPENILAVVYNNNGAVYNDVSAVPGKTYTYGVKALSNTGIESAGAAVGKI